MDGESLGANDGAAEIVGELLGGVDGTSEGVEEGTVLGADDGTVLGSDVGAPLGAIDGHEPQVALHVWKTPSFLQCFILSISAQVVFIVLFFVTISNSPVESLQGSQAPHITGQIDAA